MNYQIQGNWGDILVGAVVWETLRRIIPMLYRTLKG